MSTSKITAPVVGFNHNLKHAGRVFHVQTEDSGLPRAHFLTHLYIGGNILASAKGSYADKLDEPDLAKIVRKMMEDQHKQMVRRLVAGEFTEMAAKYGTTHYEPGVLADGHTGPAAVNVENSAPNDAAAVARLSPEPAAQPAIAPPPTAAAGPAKKIPSAPGAALRMFEERPLPARTHHEQAPSTRMPLITREAETAATTLEEAFAAAAAQLADEGPAPELLNPPPRTRPKPPPSKAGEGTPAAQAEKPGSARAPPSPQPTPRSPAPAPSILAPPTASHPAPLPAASPSARPLPSAPQHTAPAPAQHLAPATQHAPPLPPISAAASAQPVAPVPASPASSVGGRRPPSFGSVAPGAFSASAGVTRAPGTSGSSGEYRLAGSEVTVSSPGAAKVGTPTKAADWDLPHDTAPGSSMRRPPPGQGARPPSKPLRAPVALPDTVPELPKIQPRAPAPPDPFAPFSAAPPASAAATAAPLAPPSTILAPPTSDPPPAMEPPAPSPPAPARMPGAPLPSTTRIAASSFRGIPPPLVTPVGPPALVPRFAPQRLQAPHVPPVMQPVAPLPQPAPPNPLNAFAEEANPEAPAEGSDEEIPPLFAEELISERSLDEVILAFLSSGDADKPK